MLLTVGENLHRELLTSLRHESFPNVSPVGAVARITVLFFSGQNLPNKTEEKFLLCFGEVQKSRFENFLCVVAVVPVRWKILL